MFSWAKKSAGQSGRSPASTSQRRRRRTPSMNVAWACRTVGVSASGWCAWRAAQVSPCRRRRDDAELRATIRQIHRQSRGTYGAPRVRAELRIGFGIHIGRKRVSEEAHPAGKRD
jgi:HTH-like domain